MNVRSALVVTLLAALLAGGAPSPAGAQPGGDVLPPELVAQLVAATQRPLDLAPTGDPARFVTAEAAWEEMAEPLILDVNRDGVLDFVVFLFIEARTGERALIVHEWGLGADAFGKVVLYVVLAGEGKVVEWAGSPVLMPAPGPAKP
ncbi:MAG TPA: hypothetical protein VLD61_09475 [Methylomirabilota bacterium]|nr:hypothetical protein [Methylomirabilota bacterium]